MGHVTHMNQCGPSNCGNGNRESRPLDFNYDWNGNLNYYSDPASGVISYQRSPLGEVTSIYNNTYQDSNNPANLISNVTNGVFGPTNWSLGNGTSAVHTFDSMGRLSGGWLCSGNGALGQSIYCSGNTQIYGFSAGYKGARVTNLCDVALNQCQNHGYDEFNRLTDVSGSSSYHYRYDRWGNPTQRSYDNGTPGHTWTYDLHNFAVGVASIWYDAAGNQIHDDTGHSFKYDAEGNVIAGWQDGQPLTQYVFNALNQRVSVAVGSNASEFIFDLDGKRYSSWIAAYNFANSGRTYWDETLLANRSQDGSTYFHTGDWLGTERMRLNGQGQLVNVQRSLAFGDAFNDIENSTGGSMDTMQFAGQEYDQASSTDHAQFRQYHPTEGRFMSPDPYDGSYDWTNPSSLNRYTYVLNNPFGTTDATGLFTLPPAGPDPVSIGIAAGLVVGEIIFDIFYKPPFHGDLEPRPGLHFGGLNQPFITAHALAGYSSVTTTDYVVGGLFGAGSLAAIMAPNNGLMLSQGKGERGMTGSSNATNNPTKKARPRRDATGKVIGWSVKDPVTGKLIPKPLIWGIQNGLNPADYQVAAGTGTSILDDVLDILGGLSILNAEP